MNRLTPLLFTATLLVLLFAQRADAGGGPQNVFLVANPESPESLRIANEYVAMRGIPGGNVFYLPWNPAQFRTRGATFRDKILLPILKELDARNLGGQIDQVVYSSHYPWLIDFGDIHKAPPQRTVDSPFASLTGATYLYQFIMTNRREFTALNTNFYFQPVTAGVSRSQAFHGRFSWEPDAKAGSEGLRYLLATSLAANVGSARDVEEAVRYLRRAVEADGTKPKGTFFFMDTNPDPRGVARRAGFDAAAAELQGLDQQASIVKGIVPSGQRAVSGITTGAPQVRLAGSNSTLVPGAIVDNLTSHGGYFAPPRTEKSQTLLTDYLHYGAAGASGTVIEPFAVPQKFPAPTLHVHYARGCSLAEAFYQSVQGPFQLLIVGDPLCQPWATIGRVDPALPGLLPSLAGTVELKPTVTYSDDARAERLELFVDGRRAAIAAQGQPLSIDTAKLGDGYHRFDVVAIGATPIETQSRWSDWIMVRNGRDALQLSAVPGGSSGQEIVVQATCTREAEIVLLHNGREAGKISGRSGQASIPKSLLGPGPVLIEARTTDTPPLSSRPLKLQVD